MHKDTQKNPNYDQHRNADKKYKINKLIKLRKQRNYY